MIPARVAVNYKLNFEKSGEKSFLDLDKKYAQLFKSMTQEQRKKTLYILDSGQYGNLGSVNWNLKSSRGKGLLKKASRGIQNFEGKRISSKMVQEALHNWAQKPII